MSQSVFDSVRLCSFLIGSAPVSFLLALLTQYVPGNVAEFSLAAKQRHFDFGNIRRVVCAEVSSSGRYSVIATESHASANGPPYRFTQSVWKLDLDSSDMPTHVYEFDDVLKHDHEIRVATISNGGTPFVILSNGEIWSESGIAFRKKSASGELGFVRALKPHPNGASFFCITADQRLLGDAPDQFRLERRSVSGSCVIASTEIQSSGLLSVSGDGTFVAITSHGAVDVRRGDTLALIQRIQPLSHPPDKAGLRIRDLCLDLDGKHVALATEAGVVVYAVQSGKPIWRHPIRSDNLAISFGEGRSINDLLVCENSGFKRAGLPPPVAGARLHLLHRDERTSTVRDDVPDLKFSDCWLASNSAVGILESESALGTSTVSLVRFAVSDK